MFEKIENKPVKEFLRKINEAITNLRDQKNKLKLIADESASTLAYQKFVTLDNLFISLDPLIKTFHHQHQFAQNSHDELREVRLLAVYMMAEIYALSAASFNSLNQHRDNYKPLANKFFRYGPCALSIVGSIVSGPLVGLTLGGGVIAARQAFDTTNNTKSFICLVNLITALNDTLLSINKHLADFRAFDQKGELSWKLERHRQEIIDDVICVHVENKNFIAEIENSDRTIKTIILNPFINSKILDSVFATNKIEPINLTLALYIALFNLNPPQLTPPLLPEIAATAAHP